MGNSSSSNSKCAVCSTADATRPSVAPGCCAESYHLECLMNHLSAGNTTCLKCHQVFSSNILDLAAQNSNANIFATPQQQQLLPPVLQVQQQQCALPPFQSQGLNQCRQRFSTSEIPEDMVAEETVSEWLQPESIPEQSNDNIDVLIECSPEFTEVPLVSTPGFNSVVSLSASSNFNSDNAQTSDMSPPMDIVCILDVSGSMGSSNKLNNLKCAVNFMRDELKDLDRMSVITFECSATMIHGLKKMTPDNKARTAHYINQLGPGGGTRIVSGLQMAHSVLQSRRTKNPISSVFLLTDGIDSSDLNDKKRIAKEMKEMGASLFVYGFGNDHDSQHLKTIADAGEGTFTFIEKSDMVIDAFGGALGAEKSIFAQNLCMTISAANGAVIKSVHSGNYRKTLDASGASVNVYFPNLMQGEQRDVLLVMDLPQVSEPVDSQAILTTRVQYSPIVGGDGVPVDVTGDDCLVSRVTDVSPDRERNNNVDVQVNRAMLDTATAASLALADQGNYNKARDDLRQAMATIKASPSCQRNDAKSVAFVSELEATIDSIKDEDVYRYGGGRSMMTEMQSNINAQRCTYTKAGRSMAFQNECSLDFQEKTRVKKAAFFGSK